MLDLDLTSPGQSSKVKTNATKWKTIWDIYARGSKLQPSEICLTSIWPFQINLGQTLVTNKGYDFLSIISNKFGHICQCYQVTALGNMLDLDLTSPGQRQWCQMKPHTWLPIHHQYYNSNSVVILNRFGDMHRPLKTCVTWTDLSRSIKVKDNGAKRNLISL